MFRLNVTHHIDDHDFFIVGRNREGQREWLNGRAEVSVRKPDEGVWQFTSFETTEMRSMVASVDLFSEVADPAGVGATLPSYGTPENGGFVWRGAAAGDIDGDGVAGPLRHLGAPELSLPEHRRRPLPGRHQ